MMQRSTGRPQTRVHAVQEMEAGRELSSEMGIVTADP